MLISIEDKRGRFRPIGAGLGALGGNALGNAKDQSNGRYQQGYYDRNGNWHPQQQQQQGYYDRYGNYHYY